MIDGAELPVYDKPPPKPHRPTTFTFGNNTGTTSGTAVIYLFPQEVEATDTFVLNQGEKIVGHRGHAFSEPTEKVDFPQKLPDPAPRMSRRERRRMWRDDMRRLARRGR